MHFSRAVKLDAESTCVTLHLQSNYFLCNLFLIEKKWSIDIAGVKKKKKAAEVITCVCLWVVSAVSTTYTLLISLVLVTSLIRKATRRKNAGLCIVTTGVVGKAERMWKAADFPTLPYLAFQQRRAAAVDSCLSSHHMELPGVMLQTYWSHVIPCH